MIRKPRVFLDASVLLAAAGSPSGGSFAAMKVLLGSGQYAVVTSTEVEREARRNLRRKFDELARIRFEALRGELMPTYVEADDSAMPSDLPSSVATKDHHVIRACVASGAFICLTPDRRHLLTEEVREWGLRHGIRFMTPGEFVIEDRLRDQGGP